MEGKEIIIRLVNCGMSSYKLNLWLPKLSNLLPFHEYIRILLTARLTVQEGFVVQIVITLLTLSLSSAPQVQHLLQLVHEPFNIGSDSASVIGSLHATDSHSRKLWPPWLCCRRSINLPNFHFSRRKLERGRWIHGNTKDPLWLLPRPSRTMAERKDLEVTRKRVKLQRPGKRR